MIRRWELIDFDTERGDVLGQHGRYLTHWGAQRWRRRLNRWLCYRPRYELRVHDRRESE